MSGLVIDARGAFIGGGIGRYTLQLLPALLAECAEYGLAVRVLIANRQPMEQVSGIAGAHVEVVVSRAGWLDAASEALWLPRETRGASLVHSLSGHWAPDDTPSVVTIHDLTARTRPDLTTADARFHGERVVEAARRATLRIAVSRTAADDLRRVLGHAAMPMAVVPEAAAPLFHDARPDPVVAARYGVVPGAYLLAVGAGQAHKNAAGLLDAYLTCGVSTPLVVAGPFRHDAPDVRRLMAQPGLARRVLTPGVVPDADLAALYAGCRVFVSASLREGFGLPVLEAMAAGAAVVATRSSSGPDVAGDAACWVEAGDTVSLARAIAEVHSDPARRAELGRRGRLRARQFSWSRTASMTVGAYSAITQARAA